MRDDILDYCYEIQWFDQHLGRMLDALEKAGELQNTIVVVTSDNGMAFPRAKANVYEYGIHMPLAIAWPAKVPAGRTVDDLVNLIDITATIYDVTGVKPPQEHSIAGRSLSNTLNSKKEGIVDATRDAVYSGRERHSSSRYNSLGYPQRCVRTHDYLYIRNFRPERWPAGTPQKYGPGGYPKGKDVVAQKLGPMHGGYHDIDACPTLSFLINQRDDSKLGHFLNLAVDRRPAAELFDIKADPGCLNNLAGNPKYAQTQKQLNERLTNYLKKTQDARVTTSDGGDVWETYPRYSGLRWFPEPEWAKENPNRVPKQDWVEQRRPK